MKLPNIVVRALAGAVFVSVLLGGLLINEYTYLVVFSLLTALALHEFYGLIEKSAGIKTSKVLNIVGGVVLFLGMALFCNVNQKWALLLYAIYLLVLFVSELYLKKEDPIKSLAYSILGQVYIAVPFALANFLVFRDTEIILLGAEERYFFLYLLAILVFIWVNDTFAYLTGMTIGKYRLFERISPKKSWEGFAGGVVFATAASVIFSHFFPVLTMAEWIGFALVVVAFGTWGDLIESLMKRTLGVKDSGNTIPGHGGILDRFDSTILAIPAVVVYLEIIAMI